MVNYTKSLRFLAVEKITFIYIIITSIIIASLSSRSLNFEELFSSRIFIVVVIFILAYLNSIWNWKSLRFARYLFLGGLLSFWYPDTFDINRVLSNHDNLIAGWEQFVFGCQPSLLFGEAYPQNWISEIFNMGYFSYYPIILGSGLYFYFFDHKKYDNFFFVVMCSFYIFYLIYILFPTAGPQYYFHVIDLVQIQKAAFPNIGYFFNFHNELHESAYHSGLFFQLVEHTQQVGERPTAAFPSSHVGISTLIMIMIFRFRKYGLFAIILPLYLALVFATVYIQAHYVVDVLSGFISAVLLFFVSNRIYNWYMRNFSEDECVDSVGNETK